MSIKRNVMETESRSCTVLGARPELGEKDLFLFIKVLAGENKKN